MPVCFHFIFFSTKCLEKKIKQAYYTICIQCAKEKNICAKCGEKTEIVEEWVFITGIYFFMSIPTITEYSMVRGIQVCSNEGLPCPFPRVDSYEILKIHWQTLRIFFSRTTGPISTQGILRWRGFKFFQMKNQSTIQFNVFSLLINGTCIIKSYVYCFELFLKWVRWPVGLLLYPPQICRGI